MVPSVSGSHPGPCKLMIDDTDHDQWVYRRDASIRRPVAELDGPASDMERRLLSPDIQFLRAVRCPDGDQLNCTVAERRGSARIR